MPMIENGQITKTEEKKRMKERRLRIRAEKVDDDQSALCFFSARRRREI